MPVAGDVAGAMDSPLKFAPILFAADFSPASYPASLYATALATHLASALSVVHVFQPNPSARGGLSQQRSSLEELLELTTDALRPKSGAAKSVLLEGNPSIVLPRLANDSPGALLLLGTHGGNSADHFGSVAETILRQAAIPILTVGQHVPEIHKALAVHRMLYVTDDSPVGGQAAPLARAFAAAFSSPIEVVRVLDRGPNRGTNQNADPAVEAVFAQPAVTISRPHAEEEILHRLKAEAFDLLLLAIDPSSTLGFNSRGTGAFRLVAESPCPVLTLTGASVR